MAINWQKKSSRKDTFQIGSTENHNRLVAETLILLGREAMGFGRFWPQETGAAYREGKLIHYGLKGSADISGIVIGGTRVEMEAKTGRATQQDNQVAFEKMIKKFGGIYFVFHTPQEALDLLLKAMAK